MSLPPPPSMPVPDPGAEFSQPAAQELPLGPIGTIADDPRRWGFGEVPIGLLFSQILVTFVVVSVLATNRYEDFDDFPMWLFAASNFPLHLGLFFVAAAATTYKGQDLVSDLRVTMVARDIPVGIMWGVFGQFILVPMVTLPVLWLTGTDVSEVSDAARSVTDRANTPVGVVALVVFVAIIAPLVEEIFFRGLCFGALRKRSTFAAPKANLAFAFAASGLIFALIHFQPILIPALTAVGILFAWLYERHGRLGPAIWAHIAFNAATVINLLARTTEPMTTWLPAA